MSTPIKGKHLPGITVVEHMRDYSKEPFFIKKLEQARTTIAKYGLPEDMKHKAQKSKKS